MESRKVVEVQAVPIEPAAEPAARPVARGGRFWPWVGIVLSALYLLNPTAGLFELLPDNFPVIGNLDEGGAALLLWTCIQSLRARRVGTP